MHKAAMLALAAAALLFTSSVQAQSLPDKTPTPSTAETAPEAGKPAELPTATVNDHPIAEPKDQPAAVPDVTISAPPAAEPATKSTGTWTALVRSDVNYGWARKAPTREAALAEARKSCPDGDACNVEQVFDEGCGTVTRHPDVTPGRWLSLVFHLPNTSLKELQGKVDGYCASQGYPICQHVRAICAADGGKGVATGLYGGGNVKDLRPITLDDVAEPVKLGPWSAFAYSKTNRGYGWRIKAPTQIQAVEEAMRECGANDCTIKKLTDADFCLVVANYIKGRETGIRYAEDTTSDKALALVGRDCLENGRQCSIAEQFCSIDAPDKVTGRMSVTAATKPASDTPVSATAVPAAPTKPERWMAVSISPTTWGWASDRSSEEIAKRDAEKNCRSPKCTTNPGLTKGCVGIAYYNTRRNRGHMTRYGSTSSESAKEVLRDCRAIRGNCKLVANPCQG